VDADGSVHFITDIYNRDPVVLQDLGEDFKIRKRDVVPDARDQ
jgi:murein L,D-transpeptidase YcbB/YkuD